MVVGLADMLTFHSPYVMVPADCFTVQVADLPLEVAVTVQDLSEVVVLLLAVSVVPDRLNPLPLADNDGVAVSVSVPPEPFTPFHVQVRVLVATAVMADVPPVLAIVVGLADTVTYQSPQLPYCLAPADCDIVQVADLPFDVAV